MGVDEHVHVPVPKKNIEMQRINFNVPVSLYERVTRISEITGQTKTSVLQSAVAVGIGTLEPTILGVTKNEELSKDILNVLQVFSKELQEQLLIKE